MQDTPFNLKNLSIAGVITLVITVIWSALYFFSFHIDKSTPDTNNYPSTLGILELHFNKKLDKDAIEKQFKSNPTQVVSFSFESTTMIRVSDQTLRITIARTPKIGNYTLHLKNIRSVTGDILNQDIPFSVVTKTYNTMSEDEKKLFDESTNEGETAPDDPIVKVLPYTTNEYKIAYTFPGEDVELPATITITMQFFPPGDNALPATSAQTAAYLEKIRTYRKEALAYLAAKQIDISKYIITYSEPELRSEFPTGYSVPTPTEAE